MPLLKPDKGSISVDGVESAFKSPMDARKCCVEMVFQDFMLCPNLDVVMNVFLGREITSAQILNVREMEKVLKSRLQEIKFSEKLSCSSLFVDQLNELPEASF